MTRQRIHVHIDAVTVAGGQLSRQVLVRAIESALADRLGRPAAPLSPEPASLEKLDARALPGARDASPEPAIARVVADVAHGVLKP